MNYIAIIKGKSNIMEHVGKHIVLLSRVSSLTQVDCMIKSARKAFNQGLCVKQVWHHLHKNLTAKERDLLGQFFLKNRSVGIC